MPIPDALKQLGVDSKSGLSASEAQSRPAKYGPNALEEKKVSALAMFGKYFWEPVPWMIEAAAVMPILVGDPAEVVAAVVPQVASPAWRLAPPVAFTPVQGARWSGRLHERHQQQM